MPVPMNNLQEATQWVYHSYLKAAPRQACKHDEHSRSPELARQLLHLCGSPDAGIPVILVAGSKGKGSTARFLSAALRSADLSVGLFTSPHLHRFTERIQVDGTEIAEAELFRLLTRVYAPAESIASALPADRYLGPIAILLAAAFLHFSESLADIAVVECGRGGTYDDTNVLANRWALLTPLLEEHLDHLGPGLEQVIAHKAGIVKSSTEAVVVGRQREDVQERLQRALAPKGARAYRYGADYAASVREITLSGTILDIQTARNTYPGLRLPVCGSFQADNLAAALQASELILGRPLSLPRLQEQLNLLAMPGRCEVVRRHPDVILDGAIHADAAAYLEELARFWPTGKVISIVGVPRDKDFAGVVQVLSRFSAEVVVSQASRSHKEFFPPEEALAFAREHTPRSVALIDLDAAISYALAKKWAEAVFIVGTQTFIAEARERLRAVTHFWS